MTLTRLLALPALLALARLLPRLLALPRLLTLLLPLLPLARLLALLLPSQLRHLLPQLFHLRQCPLIRILFRSPGAGNLLGLFHFVA